MKKLILLAFALIANVFAGEAQEMLCGNKSLLYCVNQFDKQCKDNNRFACWAVRVLYEEQGLHSEAKKYYGKALSVLEKGELEQVKTLIEKEGVDIATVGADALVGASFMGNLEVVKYLISKGADINAKDNGIGWTALMGASILGNLEVVKYLIDKGADINAKNDMGLTALMSASETGQLEVVQYLISKGADINAKGDIGTTALMRASILGHLEVVKYLINKGADINAKNDMGWTALMGASMFRHLEVVKYLINKGADINAKDNDGWTALMWAEDGARSEKAHKTVEVLRNAGAKTAKEIKK